MNHFSVHTEDNVKEKFENYPPHVLKKIMALRNLILQSAEEIESIVHIEETLKWGEPSYLVKKGTTIRMDWKPNNPDQYALYFNCNTRMVPTIRDVFGNLFHYEKNRAIIFRMNDRLPMKALKKCISTALQYHSLKHLPLLGM